VWPEGCVRVCVHGVNELAIQLDLALCNLASQEHGGDTH
jgi:hypothetical protein